MTRPKLRFTAVVAAALTLAASFTMAQNDPSERRPDVRTPPPRKEQSPPAQQPAEKTPLQKFMRVKLAAADLVLEGVVTEEYLQLTLSCVRCHQHVRQNRVAASGRTSRRAHFAAVERQVH